MEIIDFEKKEDKDFKLQLKPSTYLVLVLIVSILSCTAYYFNWKSQISHLENLMSNSQIDEAIKTYKSLEEKIIKFHPLDSIHTRLQYLNFSTQLEGLSKNYFSQYSEPHRWINYSDIELDSIKKNISLIRNLENEFDSILKPLDRVNIGIKKLTGISKILLDENNFENLWDAKNYDIFSSSKANIGEPLISYELEALEVIKSLDSMLLSLEINTTLNKEGNDRLIKELNYQKFLLSPTTENMLVLIGSPLMEKINSRPKNGIYSDESKDYENIKSENLEKILWRLMGNSDEGSRLSRIQAFNKEKRSLRNPSEVIFNILKGYLIWCKDCRYNEKIIVYFLNSIGIKSTGVLNPLFFYESIYNNSSIYGYLPTGYIPENLTKEIFESYIEKAKIEKDDGWFAEVIFRYALFLHQTKQLGELAKLSNNLKNLLKEVECNIEYGTNVKFKRTLIAGVYYLDSAWRAEKEDWKKFNELYNEIDDLLGLSITTKDETIEVIYRKPSNLLNNKWVGLSNQFGNNESTCEPLEKAYLLNPERYYDVYLRNCN